MGGLNVLNFTIFNQIKKNNWLKNFFFLNQTSIFNIVPYNLFEKLGGLHFFLLQCPYIAGKLPIALANYHKQALLYCSLLYKHNFSPSRCFIWNNGNITHNNKSLYMENWVQHNILIVNQLIDKNGQLYTYPNFITKCLFCKQQEFNKIIKAIPSGIIILTKFSDVNINNASLQNPQLPNSVYCLKVGILWGILCILSEG